MAYMDRDHNGFLSDFERDADGDGIPNMDEGGSKDEARITTAQPADDPNYYDYGLFTQSYIELAAEADQRRRAAVPGHQPGAVLLHGQAARTRSRPRRSIRSTGCRPTPTATGSATTRTTRTTTTSRTSRSTCRRSPRPFKDRKYRQLDACVPNSDSRFCLLGSADVDGDGIPNRDDTDDDGDGLPDTLEQTLGTDPLRADSDSDGVSDGYEYWSALDLNGAAHPFPGKAPYPNALDGTDADLDFDGDGLTLKQEYQAWNYSGRPLPLNYSDGNPSTGGTALRDGAKDVDGDGLTNFEETSGPMRIDWWTAKYDGQNGPKETPVPGRRTAAIAEPSFIDPDSDGDGILDGNDDQDHDGYPNWFEASRPADWATTYTSTASRTRRRRATPTRWPASTRSTRASRSTATPATTAAPARLLRARRGLGQQRHARHGAAHGHAARHARLARGTAATVREPPGRMAGGSRRSGTGEPRRAARHERPTASAAARGRGGRVGRPVEVAVARVLEGVPQGVHRRREVRELVEVLLAERLELAARPGR